MTFTLLCAALLSGSGVFVDVQQTASGPTATDAPSAPVAPGQLNGDSPIEAIAATPAGKASLDKNVAGVLSHPAYDQFKGMSLRALAPLSGGLITEAKITAVETDLKAAK